MIASDAPGSYRFSWAAPGAVKANPMKIVSARSKQANLAARACLNISLLAVFDIRPAVSQVVKLTSSRSRNEYPTSSAAQASTRENVGETPHAKAAAQRY